MAKTGHSIDFQGFSCYYGVFEFSILPFHGTVMLSSLRTVFNFPVTFAYLFPRQAEPVGQRLIGDHEMPATRIPTWPSFANAIRNAVLATFVWRTYSLLKVRRFDPSVPYHLAFGSEGAWMVMPRVLTATYIAVKHGHEDCGFATIGVVGNDISYTVLARGDRGAILQACLADLRRSVSKGAHRLAIEQAHDFVTFV